MAAAPAAMASKARVEALNNSRHVLDFQSAFDRPYQFLALSEQATIEWGGTGDAAAPHAEGGFVKRHGDDSAFGVYFGRRSADFSEAVAKGNTLVATAGMTGTFMLEQNGLNLFYASKMADWTYGITVKYSNGKDDGAGTKANSAGLAVGATNGAWDVELVQGLGAKSELNDGTNTATVESKALTSLTVGYHVSPEMEVYGNFKTVKVEGSFPAPVNDVTVEKTSYKLGMVNTLVKTDEGNFFYGVELASSKTKDTTESMTLPVYMGVEANAASWLVLRASVAQNVILNETKDISGTPATDGDKEDLDSTKMAAGAGIKFGKSMIDATFSDTVGGTINSNNFFSQVAYTYTF
ncbi:hypothetical protein EZJ49_03660 [Bdellovibrio bacteriovorus]|uniref:hypothetical protein n=1 Tax=Bdellovibrio bacteriovorus TaxID=959 RepID=UPI0021CE98D9|nr:hypothetical protein [Bdellovibrio bacteriovorus]UXR65347.1 hypothetical protein EZJ49_03660 [Bdellovibrio bacteriovorus]